MAKFPFSSKRKNNGKLRKKNSANRCINFDYIPEPPSFPIEEISPWIRREQTWSSATTLMDPVILPCSKETTPEKHPSGRDGISRSHRVPNSARRSLASLCSLPGRRRTRSMDSDELSFKCRGIPEMSSEGAFVEEPTSRNRYSFSYMFEGAGSSTEALIGAEPELFQRSIRWIERPISAVDHDFLETDSTLEAASEKFVEGRWDSRRRMVLQLFVTRSQLLSRDC